MKGWYEDYKDLRRANIKTNSELANSYEEDRDLITSNDECSRCNYQSQCQGQCCTDDEIDISECEDCDQDPAYCINVGCCQYNK